MSEETKEQREAKKRSRRYWANVGKDALQLARDNARRARKCFEDAEDHEMVEESKNVSRTARKAYKKIQKKLE